ncbi:MAG TPA: hypothetical protein VJ851_05625 [Jatrophihabitans sp.]|nr:hypothetical protein [Jatrophihabitans sp.]
MFPIASDGSAPVGRCDYDGRDFGPAELPAGSVIGHYHQQQNLVSAEFAGDSVLSGRLVGVVDEHGVIDAAYCQIMRDGEVVAGRCVSTPTVLADGRLSLTERWHRIDGSSGVSRIMEIAREPADAGTAGVSAQL